MRPVERGYAMRPRSISHPFKITICGIDELLDHRDAKVTHVVSILDPLTPEPEAFGSYGEHAKLELRFHDVIEDNVTGYASPQMGHIEELLAFGRDAMAEPRADGHILIHCHMGISRSTAAAVLLLAESRPDWSAPEVMRHVAGIRSKAWPNLRMIELGDRILDKGGNLVKAVRNRHRQLARALPHVAEFMRESGRARELD
jgi:predicted protein tyrosine phosphatase